MCRKMIFPKEGLTLAVRRTHPCHKCLTSKANIAQNQQTLERLLEQGQRPQEKWEAQFSVTCPHFSLMDTNKAPLKWVFPKCIVSFFKSWKYHLRETLACILVWQLSNKAADKTDPFICRRVSPGSIFLT